jgi:hypothetical protein
MTGTSGCTPSFFISYSHADETWNKLLQKQLDFLGMEGILDVWEDRRIAVGDDWRAEIERAIQDPDVAVLLISADFLTSEFIRFEEVGPFLARRHQDGMRVFPILIRPCPWLKVDWLSAIQMRPADGRVVSAGNDHQIDKDFASIAEEISDLLTVRGKKPRRTANRSTSPKIDLTRLPAVCEHLLGREKELAQFDEAWTDPSKNIISLVACGGVGKSVLTKHWLDRVAGDGFRGAEVVYAWSFIARERTVARGRRMSFLLPRLAGLGRMSLRR